MKLLLTVLALLLLRPAHAHETLMFQKGFSASNSDTPIVRDSAYAMTQDLEYKQWRARIGYINEGHLRGLKRDGLFLQWVGQHRLTPTISPEFAAGPYLTATTVPGTVSAWRDEYGLAGIGGFALGWDFTRHLTASLTWHHPMFNRNNMDTDVFLLGVGWHP
jgi:hypothetical protein